MCASPSPAQEVVGLVAGAQLGCGLQLLEDGPEVGRAVEPAAHHPAHHAEHLVGLFDAVAEVHVVGVQQHRHARRAAGASVQLLHPVERKQAVELGHQEEGRDLAVPVEVEGAFEGVLAAGERGATAGGRQRQCGANARVDARGLERGPAAEAVSGHADAIAVDRRRGQARLAGQQPVEREARVGRAVGDEAARQLLRVGQRAAGLHLHEQLERVADGVARVVWRHHGVAVTGEVRTEVGGLAPVARPSRARTRRPGGGPRLRAAWRRARRPG